MFFSFTAEIDINIFLFITLYSRFLQEENVKVQLTSRHTLNVYIFPYNIYVLIVGFQDSIV